MEKRGPKPKRREVRWSPALAYAVGLIATDGCLSGDGRHLTFVSKDREQVDNLKRCLDLKVKTGVHRSGRKDATRTYHRVQWGDVVLYDFLASLGLTANKSLTLGALAIPDAYFFDFLRGSFDGDGSFYSYYDPRWESSFMFYLVFTSASRTHIDWLQSRLARLLRVRGHITSTRGTGKERNIIYHLRFAKGQGKKVLARMYSKTNAPCLSRKRLKIVRALRIVGESLPSIRKGSIR